MHERYQGRSLNRLEDHRFLTGHGKYVANDHVPGALHLHMVRSPVAFARIARLDLAAARALPGVVAVYSEADLVADGIGELPCLTVFEAVELCSSFRQAQRWRTASCGMSAIPVVCIVAEFAGGGDGGGRSGGRRL